MLEYVGTGDFVMGVPARALNDDDLMAAAAVGWDREALLETGLYREADVSTGTPGTHEVNHGG